MSTQYVIRNKKMQPIPQNDDATCWLAAYQMMFDWKGKAKDSIRGLLKGWVADVDICYKKGLDQSEWQKAASAFGMKSVAGKKPFTAAELAGYLSNGPVLVHGKFPLGMHSIVVTGVTVADSSGEPEDTTYINPYWVGTPQVSPRTSAFNLYLKIGVEANNGKSAVIQYW